MIRRVLLVALCGLHCARPAKEVGFSAAFTREPLVEDCVTMARSAPDPYGRDALKIEVRRADAADLLLFATDERWVLQFFSVPPPRANRSRHDIRDLLLTCGTERISLQSLACRGGHGLRLYVDPTPLAGRARGTPDAACRLSVTIDGTLHEVPRELLIRPGLRAWFADAEPTIPAEDRSP